MSSFAIPKFGVGARALRLEDDRLIKGEGHFVSDETPENVLYAYILRSSVAHGQIKHIDVSAAQDEKGVHLVLTGADIKGKIGPVPVDAGIEATDGELFKPEHPVLVDDRVRFVGDAIAYIVADTMNAARNAAELIEVDIEDLDVVTTIEEVMAGDGAALHEAKPDNIAFRAEIGDKSAADDAFAKADHVIELTIYNNRLVPNYMETRGITSSYDQGSGRYRIVLGSQGVHGQRRALAGQLGIDEKDLHVITPDVGGGFGPKAIPYREYALTVYASKLLNRPVKWWADRTEQFLQDAHGRDNLTTARMALNKEGRFTGLDITVRANLGAYISPFGPLIPWLGVIMGTGVYDIQAYYSDIIGIYTNTAPVDAYRGAGRPEAIYMLERLVDKIAMDLDMDPAELRRKNFISPEQMPYKTMGRQNYDTGNFANTLDIALQRADMDGFEMRNKEAQTRGKIRGIGISSYVEVCAFAGSEFAKTELNDDGGLTLYVGTQTNGQGHQTAYAQIAASQLGVNISEVKLVQGDSDLVKRGGGTGGSRSVPLGGAAVEGAATILAESIRKKVAQELEVGEADIELADGQARIVGTDRGLSFAQVAAQLSAEEKAPEYIYKQDGATYPNGTHIVEVEIDPETGQVEIDNYTIVDDYGVVINPLLLEGQVHGGIVQAAGQVLMENVVYDETGQLLTASFMDYAMPRADLMPKLDFSTDNIRCESNAMGIKGAGEAGTIGATPAVMNAVINALWRAYGIDRMDMPTTPDKVWHAIQHAKT